MAALSRSAEFPPEHEAMLPSIRNTILKSAGRFYAWVIKHRDWPRTHRLYQKAKLAFTVHPAETSETYGQHLWFTVKTSVRFIFLGTLLFLHGVFPFIFTRVVSRQTERIYLIMRSRIPKVRRETIDVQYDI